MTDETPAAMLTVEITGLLAQEDRFKSAEEGRDLISWKRVVARGAAREHLGPTPIGEARFEVVMDYRAHLLSVAHKESNNGPSPEQIAHGLVNEMSHFVHVPIQQMIRPVDVPRTEHRSEWTLTDPDHIGGLLHRLRELGPFNPRATPHVPAQIADMRHALMDEMRENLSEIISSFKENDGGLDVNRYLLPRLAAWKAFGPTYISQAPNAVEREVISRYFEMTLQFERMWQWAIISQAGQPDYAPAIPQHIKNTSVSTLIRMRSLRDKMRSVAAQLGLDISVERRS